jgi:hypothetical protein
MGDGPFGPKKILAHNMDHGKKCQYQWQLKDYSKGQ